MRACPILLLLLVAGAARADIATPTAPSSPDDQRRPDFCHTSPGWQPARDEIGYRIRTEQEDVDGDDIPDELNATSWKNEHGGSTRVTVSLSRSRRTVSVRHRYSLDSMWATTAVPDEAIANAPLRRFIEEALAPIICDHPDGALDRLLRVSAPLRFIEGPPYQFKNYLVYSTDPEATSLSVDIGERAPRGVWIDYVHAYDEPPGNEGGPAFRVLAQRGDQVLLGSAHGVVLTDARRTRHAWLWVTLARVRDLQHTRIRAARFAGDYVIIDADYTRVRVHLKTGVTKSAVAD